MTNYLERVAEENPLRTRHLAARAFFSSCYAKYEEYFFPEEYNSVFNSQNNATVEKINDIAKKINELRSQKISGFGVIHPFWVALVGLISDGDRKTDY